METRLLNEIVPFVSKLATKAMSATVPYSLMNEEMIKNIFYLLRQFVLNILGIAEGIISCVHGDNRQRFQPFLDLCETLFRYYQDFPLVVKEDNRKFNIELFDLMRGVGPTFNVYKAVEELAQYSAASEEEWKPWLRTIDSRAARAETYVLSMNEHSPKEVKNMLYFSFYNFATSVWHALRRDRGNSDFDPPTQRFL